MTAVRVCVFYLTRWWMSTNCFTHLPAASTLKGGAELKYHTEETYLKNVSSCTVAQRWVTPNHCPVDSEIFSPTGPEACSSTCHNNGNIPSVHTPTQHSLTHTQKYVPYTYSRCWPEPVALNLCCANIIQCRNFKSPDDNLNAVLT